MNVWKKKLTFILVLLSELLAVDGAQAREQGGFLRLVSWKDLEGTNSSGKAPGWGQIIPQLRPLSSHLAHRQLGSLSTARGWIQSSTVHNLWNGKVILYKNCQQTELISTSPATRKTNFDRGKKWIFAVCFSSLFTMWFQSAFLVALNWTDGWR